MWCEIMNRIKKALKLIEKDNIELLHQDEAMMQFIVYSTANKSYMVNWNYKTFWCSCEDAQYNHATCKHQLAVIGFLFNERTKGQMKLDLKEGTLTVPKSVVDEYKEIIKERANL
jgi:predicted nucleic acid-binding Zn finger protein